MAALTDAVKCQDGAGVPYIRMRRGTCYRREARVPQQLPAH